MAEQKSLAKSLFKTANRAKKNRTAQMFWNILQRCQTSAQQGDMERDFYWNTIGLDDMDRNEREKIVEKLKIVLADHGLGVIDLLGDRRQLDGICVRWDEESTGKEESVEQ